MSLEVQRVYLSDRLAALKLGIPAAMPNQPFSRPPKSPYAEYHLMGGDNFVAGIEGDEPGGRVRVRVRYVHILQMTVWIPEGQGTKAATTAAEVLGKRFAGRQGRDPAGSFYRFQNLTPLTSGRNAAGWEVTVYRIPFTRDQIEVRDPGLTL